MRVPLAALLFLGSVSVLPLPLAAQGDSATVGAVGQVQVVELKADYARAAGGENWLEFSIELDVKPGGRAVSGEFVDRVGVSLALATEAAGGSSDKKRLFYRSSVDLISLESGRHVVRFYLPPEVVKRDRLRAQADFYAVGIEVAGRVQPPSAGAVSKAFSTPDSVKNFQSQVSSEGGNLDGILLPQYLTPFAGDSRRPAPSPLRRETRR